ncbi:hypothetical protein M422DRAFT_777984 [Sphaerobolus stellatus SS14]|uniref:DUF1996 domain-containing protein n=1 Tax=Sphaerobolus stellatus (strain SS14) TaxID=990650 RepID=A0A0C9VIP4_SPHS4|nr:hypothetical protein M422DRAFT_777984 [Sphaerobolus stellatus SS14]
MKNLSLLGSVLAAVSAANAYFLIGHTNVLVTERLDPIMDPGAVSAHVHTIQGGSNFGPTTTTAQLRQSTCSTVPIKEDHSNYWIPQLYFQWNNGSVSSLTGGMVTYYLFSDTPGTTTAFPDDFRMISGTTTLRTYDPTSFAQQAVTFLCLDFSGTSTRYNQLPVGISCPSGIRSQINFQSCWDGKNVDSPDHKSHVAFPSGGPDSGTCDDPNFPVTLPRVFLEYYWAAQDFEQFRSQALDPKQPFVFANGDATGYGYHADFFNGWDEGVLQRVVDGCHCNPSGDPTCCSQAGLFTFESAPGQCSIDPVVEETVQGMLPRLPGNNPITGGNVTQPASAAPVNGGTPVIKGGAPAVSDVPASSFVSAIPTAAAAESASLKTVITSAVVLPTGVASSAVSSVAAASSAAATSVAVASGAAMSAGAAASSGDAASSAAASTADASAASATPASGSDAAASSAAASAADASAASATPASGSTPASSGSSISSNSGSNTTSTSSGSSKQCKRSSSKRRSTRRNVDKKRFNAHKMSIEKRGRVGLAHVH